MLNNPNSQRTKQLHFTNEELASIVALLEMFSDKKSLLQGAAGEDALDVRDVLSVVRELQSYRAKSDGPADDGERLCARCRGAVVYTQPEAGAERAPVAWIHKDGRLLSSGQLATSPSAVRDSWKSATPLYATEDEG